MRAYLELPASNSGRTARVLMDVPDAERLGNRRLSIGSHGYAQMWNGVTVCLLHRWLMDVEPGTGYRVIVDHINRDPLDCRRSNLRLVSPSESNLNRSIALRALPIGVYLSRSGNYQARLKRNRVSTHLGTFPTSEQAAAAVTAALLNAEQAAA